MPGLSWWTQELLGHLPEEEQAKVYAETIRMRWDVAFEGPGDKRRCDTCRRYAPRDLDGKMRDGWWLVAVCADSHEPKPMWLRRVTTDPSTAEPHGAVPCTCREVALRCPHCAAGDPPRAPWKARPRPEGRTPRGAPSRVPSPSDDAHEDPQEPTTPPAPPF